MERCIAPSEVRGITTSEASIFGALAENLVYYDFVTKYGSFPNDMYVDKNDPATYLYFLGKKNPHLSLFNYYTGLRSAEVSVRRPDLLIDSFSKKEFYEIKPNSESGYYEGISKVGELSATYKFFSLPYIPGITYRGGEMIVASFAGQLEVKFKALLRGPGLIVYQLCVNAHVGFIELVTFLALLRYIIKQMNKQVKSQTFKPIDLRPAFAAEGQLRALALGLGLIMVVGSSAVRWSFFLESGG